ncbi:MAG: DNA mismatch endonuclease Vsr [Acidaminobacter sp.]|uniref:very short patch repair endonuclease n=1 Tax=Acidaminobacter sp. TaxID=1872102 RepID=UPI00137E311F|nr:very short patch repair endonuclease [Acidaminobacter sp.]MZQ99466.1 DNA mismatch endonuclease Vsr [Acidaminobacter sp.]
MDNHSKDVRSYNMSRIRSKDTKPEEFVRKYLFSKGFRYRKNDNRLPGCPDIVLPKYKIVIFVNGCFWHKHKNCPRFKWPKTNIEYWTMKIERNIERDAENYDSLEQLGWRILVIWECTIKKMIKDVEFCNDVFSLAIEFIEKSSVNRYEL